MNQVEQRLAAKRFAENWLNKGDEKQDTQQFWMALLQNVYGVEFPADIIQFEQKVKLNNTSYIDGYINETKVLIEQKSRNVDLRQGYQQSDGSILTPFQQARRYSTYLPHDKNPRWIVVCNFHNFEIHDMNRPNDEPEVLVLGDLEKEFHRLNFLVNSKDENIRKEIEVSLKAGELVGILYNELLKQYKNPDDPDTLKSLNKLCVRLVFCLYAEDAGLFGNHKCFHDYLEAHRFEDRIALIRLFKVLNTEPENRDPL